MSETPSKRGGESPLHRKVKEKIAEGLNELGYIANTEFRSKRGRFDVYAISPDRTSNIAVEVYRTHAPSWMKKEAKVREFLVAQVYEEKIPRSLFTLDDSGLRKQLDEERAKNRSLSEEISKLRSLLKTVAGEGTRAKSSEPFTLFPLQYGDLIALEQVADLLKLPNALVVSLIAEGKIKAIRLPNDEWRFKEEDIRKLLRYWKPSALVPKSMQGF